jgi:hypothetical protein
VQRWWIFEKERKKSVIWMNGEEMSNQYRDTQSISDWFKRDCGILGSPETKALNEKVNECLEKNGLENCSKYTCPKDRPCYCDAFMERGRSNVKDLERALNLQLSTGLASVILDAVEFYLQEQFDQRVDKKREAGNEEDEKGLNDEREQDVIMLTENKQRHQSWIKKRTNDELQELLTRSNELIEKYRGQEGRFHDYLLDYENDTLDCLEWCVVHFSISSVEGAILDVLISKKLAENEIRRRGAEEGGPA